jgi:hypothetical protein
MSIAKRYCASRTLHEQIGNPQSKEQISGTKFFFARIFAQVKEIKNVRVPRLSVPLIKKLAPIFKPATSILKVSYIAKLPLRLPPPWLTKRAVSLNTRSIGTIPLEVPLVPAM